MKFKLLTIIAILFIGLVGFYLWQEISAPEPNVTGTVTAYVPGPGPADEPTIFRVDGDSIYIGGDMSGPIVESFDNDIKEGDKVKAYAVEDENGYLTIVNCDKCYVKKIE